jgi:hypothetical protein
MEEVLNSETENRVWNKELRLRTRALVNSRLAKAIDADEYAATRRFTNEDTAECTRRGILLVNEIRSREGRAPSVSLNLGVPLTD